MARSCRLLAISCTPRRRRLCRWIHQSCGSCINEWIKSVSSRTGAVIYVGRDLLSWLTRLNPVCRWLW
jgi:hypothetical protein